MVLSNTSEKETRPDPALPPSKYMCAENNTPEREGMSQEEPDLLETLYPALTFHGKEEHVSRLFGGHHYFVSVSGG